MASRFLRVALVVLLASLAACGGARSRFQSHMERGQRYYGEDNYAKAAIEFRNALQIVPNDPQARFMLSSVAEKLGNVRGAVAGYQSVIELAPGFTAARERLGRIYVLNGVPQQALETIAPALAQHPDDAILLTVRASAHMQLKDQDAALKDAERAVELAPADDDAAATLAAVYRQAGDVGRAKQFIEQQVKSRPNSIGMHQVLAELYETADDSADAERELKQTVQLQPHVLAFRTALAALDVRAQKLDDAEAVLNEAVQQADERDAAKLAYLNFIATYRSPARAEKTLEDYISHEPDNYALQLELAGAQQRRGAQDAATATYEKVIAQDRDGPSGLTARTRLAALYLEQDRHADASRLLDAVLEKNPRDVDALSLRASLALQRGAPTSAVEDLRAVLREEPSAVPPARELATAYLLSNQPALAEETLKSTLQAHPADVGLRTQLASVYTGSQRVDEAIRLLREGVQMAPEDASLREALVETYLRNKDIDAARTAADDMEKAQPHSAAGPYLAGVVALAQKRNEDAVRDFERALELQPSAMDALSKLAHAELVTGHGKQAIARVGAEVARHPDNGPAHNLLGELYVESKDFPHAIAEFSAATRLAPKWPVAWRNLAMSRFTAGDAAGAIAAYQAGIAAAPFNSELANGLADLYLLQHRVDDAMQVYESLHTRDPELAMAANNLALLLVTYKTDRTSLDRARRLSEPFASSANSVLLDTNGWVRLKCGEAGALPVLQKAAALEPGSKMILYHLGMAELAAGDRSKARSSLEASLASGASFMGVDEARRTLEQLEGKSG